jgi:hypothetical protein
MNSIFCTNRRNRLLLLDSIGCNVHDDECMPYKGPRASPAVDLGTIYTHGMAGYIYVRMPNPETGPST